MQSPHIHGFLVEGVVGKSGSDPDFDLLCRAFAHDHVVHLLQVDADGITDFIASDPHGFAENRSSKTQHRHLGGTAADINDHRSDRLRDRQTGTDGSGNGFIDEMNLTRTGHPGFADGPALHTRHTTGNPNHQTRGHDAPAFIALGDEGFEHLFGSIEIGDDAIPQRPNGTDVARGPAQHQLRLVADGKRAATLKIKSHH